MRTYTVQRSNAFRKCVDLSLPAPVRPTTGGRRLLFFWSFRKIVRFIPSKDENDPRRSLNRPAAC